METGAMTKHKTGTRANGPQRGSSCSKRRNSSCGRATSWRDGDRSCRGFGSTLDARQARSILGLFKQMLPKNPVSIQGLKS
jgi:hypothetical protein